MAIPSIPTALAGAKAGAAGWADSVQEVLAWQQNPPAVHVYNSSAQQSFANSTMTLCTYGDEQYDWSVTPMHSTSANPSRITLPESGLYQINVFAACAAATYTAFEVMVRANSGGSTSGGTSIRDEQFTAPPVKWTFERRFTAADYIEVFLSQTSGGARLNTAFALAHGVQARWVAI